MKSPEHDAKSPTQRDRPSLSPLDRKIVLVTRTAAQSSEITRQLEELGATVLHCPTIEIAPPVSWEDIDRAIGAVGSYDWLVFTSANGAQNFFSRFAELRAQVFQESVSQFICAIGPATARAIESAGARVDLLVKDSRAEGVLREIVERLGSEDAIRELSFLVPCARHARDFLPVELRRLGGRVDVVEAYQTLKPNVDVGSLFQLYQISAITFTSPSTVSNFAKLVEADLLDVLCRDMLAACIGPVTAAAAAEQGFKRIVQADSANSHALAKAIATSVNDE
jgi:uroporphyrinogen III methyltransferase / synthase